MEKQDSVLAHIWNKTIEHNIPFVMLLELTYKCNLHCQHCYIIKENRSELTYSQITKLLDELANNGTLYLTLSGGEVMVREDFWDIVEYAKKLNFALRIYTNGTLLTSKDIERFAAIPILNVGISIYSASADIHDKITGQIGSWEKAISSLEQLKLQGIETHFKYIFTKLDFHQYKKAMKLAEKLGAIFKGDPTVSPRNDYTCDNVEKLALSKEQLMELYADPEIYQSINICLTPDNLIHKG